MNHTLKATSEIAHLIARPILVVAVLLGILATAGAIAQEPLLNLRRPPAQTSPAQVSYAPATPPAASNPGVLEAPALVARNLNESDVDYTARMQQQTFELKAETARLMQRHDEVMRNILAGFGGRKEPRFDPSAAGAPPLPAATLPAAPPASPSPVKPPKTGRGLLVN
ncbi:MAG: hypothetical protein WKF61_00390 [Luteimonas sp.]